MSIITLTTDFGLKDGFVGVLKGVIWGIDPAIQIADISHQIAPQNVLEGALVLARAAPFFPPGTVHVAVVDPGVGTSRRPLAARLGTQFVVGPDNGLFTPLIEAAEASGRQVEFVQLDRPEYWLPSVSRTFHGRDIFAPVGARLAGGAPLAALGTPIRDPLKLALPRPQPTPSGWRAQVVWVDTFGNLTLDLSAADIAARPGTPVFHLGGQSARGLAQAYGDHPAGALLALIDSEGQIEIAVVNGSAAQFTGARPGQAVEVVYQP
jgi:S-adenosylmethionine hydrolase